MPKTDVIHPPPKNFLAFFNLSVQLLEGGVGGCSPPSDSFSKPWYLSFLVILKLESFFFVNTEPVD